MKTIFLLAFYVGVLLKQFVRLLGDPATVTLNSAINVVVLTRMTLMMIKTLEIRESKPLEWSWWRMSQCITLIEEMLVVNGYKINIFTTILFVAIKILTVSDGSKYMGKYNIKFILCQIIMVVNNVLLPPVLMSSLLIPATVEAINLNGMIMALNGLKNLRPIETPVAEAVVQNVVEPVRVSVEQLLTSCNLGCLGKERLAQCVARCSLMFRG